jgi:hypothetical protein
MSSRAKRPLVPVLLSAAALLSAHAYASPTPSHTSKQGGIAYKWVDEQGVVHYGDHIPPQYAQQDREVLNSQGVPVGHLEAAQTPEQSAAAALKKAEVFKQRQHDSFLVSTYTSVKDIETLRDLRLDQLRGQRAAAEQYVESLRARLGSLQTRAVSYQPYNSNPDARRMPDDLAENLVRTLNEVEKTLRAQFDADIQRYRELHAIHEQ